MSTVAKEISHPFVEAVRGRSLHPADEGVSVGDGVYEARCHMNVRENVGVRCKTRGDVVVVESVAQGSAAERAGVTPGCQLHAVCGHRVSSAQDAASLIRRFQVNAGANLQQVLPLTLVVPLPPSAPPLCQVERDCNLAAREARLAAEAAKQRIFERRM